MKQRKDSLRQSEQENIESTYDIYRQRAKMRDSYGYKAGRRRLRRQKCYIAVIFIFLLLTIGLIYLVVKRQENVMEELPYCAILYAACAFSLLFFKLSGDKMDLYRVGKLGLQEKLAYNEAIYTSFYRNNKSLQAAILLVIARQNLQLEKAEEAKRALTRISLEKLNKDQLKSYYLYQTIALYLSEEAEWKEALMNFHAIPIKRSSLTEEELDELFQTGNIPKLLEVLESWDRRPMQKRPIVTFLAGVLTLYTGVFFCVENLLPQGYFYRTGFALWSAWLLLFFWILLTFYWLVCLIRIIRRSERMPVKGKTLFCILLSCLWVIVCLFGTFGGLLYTIGKDAEVEERANGLLYMRHDNWLDPADYYYRISEGPFLCRRLTEEEYQQYGLIEDEEESNEEKKTQEETYQKDKKAQEETYQEDKKAQEEIYQEDTQQEEDLHAEILAVYERLAENGEIEDQDSSQLTISYTAKGTPYTIFQIVNTDGSQDQGRLVYDRISANGECDLFVYYLYSGNVDTSILEFYAVNRQTLEVIPGEKNSWSDLGSEEYREATGE